MDATKVFLFLIMVVLFLQSSVNIGQGQINKYICKRMDWYNKNFDTVEQNFKDIDAELNYLNELLLSLEEKITEKEKCPNKPN